MVIDFIVIVGRIFYYRLFVCKWFRSKVDLYLPIAQFKSIDDFTLDQKQRQQAKQTKIKTGDTN